MSTTSSEKVAFVTGAASGIGYEMVLRCLDLGMKVVAADIDAGGLEDLKGYACCQTVVCDVTSLESLKVAASIAESKFGPVSLLVNNAGVFGEGGAGDLDLERFRWIVDVNLMSIVMGVEVFLPQLLENRGSAFVLNTASVAGHIGYANLLAYSTSKHAVIGYSESLAEQLKGQISVSILCPGFVNTRIAETARYKQGNTNNEDLQVSVAQGMAPGTVAAYAIDRVFAGDRYIFTHPRTYREVTERLQRIDEAFQLTRADGRIMADPDAQRVASRSGTEESHE